MRCVLRWTYNFAALASALLFVATCVLWVRTHGRRVILRSAPQSWELASYGNGIEFNNAAAVESARQQIDRQSAAWFKQATHGSDTIDPNDPNFPPMPPQLPPPPKPVRYTADFQDVTVLAAVLPLYWVFVWRLTLRSRASRPGRCSACGYDLCATPTRCPECGAVPTPTEVA